VTVVKERSAVKAELWSAKEVRLDRRMGSHGMSCLVDLSLELSSEVSATTTVVDGRKEQMAGDIDR